MRLAVDVWRDDPTAIVHEVDHRVGFGAKQHTAHIGVDVCRALGEALPAICRELRKAGMEVAEVPPALEVSPCVPSAIPGSVLVEDEVGWTGFWALGEHCCMRIRKRRPRPA